MGMINTNDPRHKVRAEHLQRDAYLYVRQSTLQQVFHNTESTQRQYDLKQRAVALGWPAEHVHVIDGDQGQSGASATDREGFQRLVAEVGLGHAGIVLGLEVSRLARNCSDWHRLLEICGLTDTLILDEDGLYDPACFNDRLLLGLKGTMSEAELHVLRARLQGGIRNKAQRGELRFALPVGLIYDSQGRLVLDPDQQVQQALRTFFQVYERHGSARAVVKYFAQNNLKFPRRLRGGIHKGQLVWGPLGHSRSLQVLRNPRYAGAYAFGRTKACRRSTGRGGYKPQPQEKWQVLIPDAHPGYITWQQYQDHLQTLHACGRAHGQDRRHSPPGQGPALLQGLVVCGVCGRRMTVKYHTRARSLVPDYVCQGESIERGRAICQQVPGAGVDQAVGALLLELVEPVTLDLAFAVQAELQSRLEEVARLRRQQVERARYEADLARSRFMQVDPNNRLVATALEADWNDQMSVDDASRQQVLALARDLPRLWRNPQTSDQDRKRVVRLLIEDVTLTKPDQIKVQIRLKGGATRTLAVPLPLNAGQLRATSPEVVRRIDQLLDHHTDAAVAAELNRRGYRSGTKREFTSGLVGRIRSRYGLKPRYERLRERGLLTAAELGAQLGITAQSVAVWRRNGLLRGEAYNDMNECLYKPLGTDGPRKQQGVRLSERRRFPEFCSQAANEVHHEA
jgi:DNA invertase Pin-like site-specific DNA recombinase